MGKTESYQVTLEKQLSISRSNSLLFRSVEDGIYALGNPACDPSHLSDVFFQFPLKRFQCSSNCRWPSLVVSKKSVEHFLFPRFSPPGDRWCNVLGFMPAGGGSSSSTVQIFREAGHLCVLLWRQFIHSVVSLHSGVPRAVHPQEFSKVGVDHCHIPV